MKRFMCVAFCMCMLLLVLISTGAVAAEEKKLSVVTTIFPPYDFVRQIAGDTVDLAMLLPLGSESHSFEPSPQDIIKIQNCDLFIYVGGEMDVWVDRILGSMELENTVILPLMDMVRAVEEELVPGMQAEEEEEEEPALDEHIWTSPRNAADIVSGITRELSALDPARADAYAENAAAYLLELDVLDAEIARAVQEGARSTVLFGDRFPFRYLADAYNLTYYAAFPGCAGEAECSAATLKFLIDTVRQENIPVVFHLEFSTEKIADAIVEATGAKKLLMHSCHTISKGDFEAGETYLSLMGRNVLALKEALF